MLKAFILPVVMLISLSTCRPQTDIFPNMPWSSGCVELTPGQDAYQLRGLCCAYILMEPVDLTRNRSFTIPGTLYVFTGAGYAGTNITIHGQVSPDHKTLSLSYREPGQSTPQNYLLEPGPAKTSCYCVCH